MIKIRTAAQKFRLATALAVAGLLPACGDAETAPPTLVEPAGSATLSQPSATATPRPLSADNDSELILNSESVDEALAPMYRFINEGGEGLARVIEENRERAAKIQWKDPVPRDIAQLAGTSGNGVQIVVEAVAFSRADLDKAIARLQAAANSGEIDRPTRYTASDGFDRLLVGYSGAAFDTAGEPASRAQLERIAQVPVTIIRANPTQPAAR